MVGSGDAGGAVRQSITLIGGLMAQPITRSKFFPNQAFASSRRLGRSSKPSRQTLTQSFKRACSKIISCWTCKS